MVVATSQKMAHFVSCGCGISTCKNMVPCVTLYMSIPIHVNYMAIECLLAIDKWHRIK